ncbi:iron complex outermembrane recepter protein [Nitratiruptor sp. YY08-26]|uniref:TonB-dependent receptor n=1 Tax=unclassified Nitratiruptor TaxID=2624044 RepID=UPI001915DC0B|nr:MULTISPECIES: TonB-dependent receptor [unclassified Nitratiruptor]BCD62948.1 iron complex outermembrane recepter protein [Nitratiruptor sp. YY08-13]BCD66883.1 iron complex outermembrane recepter protein [Nitratiruptor sp. YY08-26]
MKKTLLLSITLSMTLFADISVEKVVVEQSALQAQTDVQADEVKFTRQQDLAEILSSYVPEINMVRASAIGNDIVLRGFKRDDINVLIDGAKIYGACPNRMDPPAMHISIADIQKVEVAEGPFDVENFGSMGGRVNVLTADPQEGFNGEGAITIGSFGYNKFDAKVEGGDEKLKFSFGVSRENSEQYEDGSGKTLVEQNWDRLGKSDPNAYQEKYKNIDAYTRATIQTKAIYDIDDNQRIKLSLYSDKATDVLYPAFQMDAQLDKTLMLNGSYIIKNLGDFSKELLVQGYYSTVTHDMGTEFRNAAVMMGGKMYRTHHVKSRIEGLKIKNSFLVADILWQVGVDGSLRNWNGICLSEPSKKPRQVRIPDVDTKNRALFVKASKTFDKLTVGAGARFDSTDIDANNLNHPTIANIAPIQNYYKGHTSRSYNDISANLKLDYKLDESSSVYVALGQGIRVPDAQELYFIGFMMGNWSRKGNPNLQETKNRELDIGLKTILFDTELEASIFYSDLKDYIYGYRTNRGNKDPKKYYLTWTNIDAHLYGGSLSLRRSLGDYMMIEGAISYQKGKKDDTIAGQTDDDLAQIPPLHARVALSYDDGEYYVMVEELASAGWKDYDSDNGERAIGGWGVMNVKASKDLSDTISLNVGIDNIFDKTYAVNNTYIGRSLIGGRNPVLINEPGRFIYANLTMRF